MQFGVAGDRDTIRTSAPQIRRLAEVSWRLDRHSHPGKIAAAPVARTH
jgi:hypothetical protein